MKNFLRPYRYVACCLVWAGGIIVVAACTAARAQMRIPSIFARSSTQAATNSHGYLGIETADVDADKAVTLHLKDTHGAVITLIDHDAPACQSGLKINDVVLQFNGQAVNNTEQLRHLLKDTSPGRKVTLEFSRDGNVQMITIELADRRLIEKKAMSRLGASSSVPEMGILSGNSMPSGFHMPTFGNTLKVGALVEPLTSQMAAYLGVESGLMVKQVSHKSEAEAAGLRAFDVILKVGSETIATSADWDRALLANQGKPVPVTILRNKKQQTLILQVDSKHHQGNRNQPTPTTPEPQQMARLENNLAPLDAAINRQWIDPSASKIKLSASAGSYVI